MPRWPERPVWWPEGQEWTPLVCDTCGVDISTAGTYLEGGKFCPEHADGTGQQQLPFVSRPDE